MAYSRPPQPDPSEEANTLATLSVIFGFVFAPAGAVLGHLALSQIKQRHQRGRDRALVGLTLSYFVIVAVVVGVVVWAALPVTTQTPTETAQPPTVSHPPPTNSSTITTAAPTRSTPPPPAQTTPVTRDTISGILLNGTELAEVVGEPFKAPPAQPPKVGGFETMPNGLATEADASPHDCVGAVSIAQRSTYQSANVTGYAAENWDTTSGGAVMGVYEAVVALPAALDAEAVFATFSEQWRRCDGQTVTILAGTAPDGSHFVDKVTNVRVVDSVVAAVIQTDHSTGGWARPRARAIGVRANCLVEVDVVFYGRSSPGATANPDTAAIDVVRALIDKIG